MANVKKFLKGFKDKKPKLYKSGDRVSLYKNTYMVMSCNEKYTLLKDSRNTPFAIPTERLNKITDLAKAKPGAISGKEVSPGVFETRKEKLQQPKMQSGMIRVDKVDKNGKKYHYFIHAQHGTKHQEQHSESKLHESQIDEESMKAYHNIQSAIRKHAHAEDVPKLMKKLNEFVAAKSVHHHLVEAHTQLTREEHGHFSMSTLQKISNKQDEYEKKLNSLMDAIKASKSRKEEK